VEWSREEGMRYERQRRQREEGIEHEDRPDAGKGRIGVREARVEDSGKGQGMERTSQQEEDSQVWCHTHVIA
jgi:hypothetical protein